MISTSELTQLVEKSIADRDAFIVTVEISASNAITIELDSKEGLDMELCAEINRSLQAHYGEELDNYDLEVGSTGLTTPFKIVKQYENVVGEKVEIVTKEGKKLKGIMKEANNEHFTIEVEMMVKLEGAKRKTLQKQDFTFAYGDVKSTCRMIEI